MAANEYLAGARFIVFCQSRDEFHMYNTLGEIVSEWSVEEWEHLNCVCHAVSNAHYTMEQKIEMVESTS